MATSGEWPAKRVCLFYLATFRRVIRNNLIYINDVVNGGKKGRERKMFRGLTVIVNTSKY